MYNLDKKELAVLKKLDTAVKIQNFLDKLEINFEEHGETCMSPRRVLKTGKAHCIEAALLAYLAFRLQGRKAWLVDMKTTKDDFEHVIAVFKLREKWGAISKSNHAVLKYREPVYKNIRELVMSYFHEYTDKKGRKTLRSFSMPVSLEKFDKKKWATDEKDLWYIHNYLDKVKHYSILNRKQIAGLRKADRIEIKAGKIVEWRATSRPRKSSQNSDFLVQEI